MASGIEEARALLTQIQQRYANPQSMEPAQQDCARITALSAQLATLPLEHMKRKPLRDQLIGQRKQIQDEANVSYNWNLIYKNMDSICSLCYQH